MGTLMNIDDHVYPEVYNQVWDQVRDILNTQVHTELKQWVWANTSVKVAGQGPARTRLMVRSQVYLL
jgi:hypothetical protein